MEPETVPGEKWETCSLLTAYADLTGAVCWRPLGTMVLLSSCCTLSMNIPQLRLGDWNLLVSLIAEP